MNQDKTNKTYVNVKFPSGWVLYAAHVVMFGLAPIPVVYWVAQALFFEGIPDLNMAIFFSAVVTFLFIILAASFYLFQNYVPYKIITDESGLCYSSLLRTVHLRWDQISSIRINEGLLTGNSFQLRTKSKKLNVPIFMKVNDDPYPKLDILRNCWTTAEGLELQLVAENCPLYREIQKHEQIHLTTGSTADRNQRWLGFAQRWFDPARRPNRCAAI